MRKFYNYLKKSRLGYTLAEVLIVLGVLGIIAEMVIPVIIVAQKERTIITGVKESYTLLSSAYKLAVLNEETPNNWTLTAKDSPAGALNLLTKFSAYLKFTKNCGTDAASDCFGNGMYKKLGGTDGEKINENTAVAKAILNNGTSFGVKVISPTCIEATPRGGTLALASVCAVAYIDVNGNNKPNTYGKDLFYFLITKYGIIPYGTDGDTSSPFSTSCKTALTSSSTHGNGCTAWVIYNSNMDYLHCSDLDWSGKHECD